MSQKTHFACLFHPAVLLLVILAVGLGACARTPAPEANPTPYPTAVIPTKPTYTVQSGEVSRVLNFVGRIEPVQREELFFKIGGRIGKIYFKVQDKVSKDQLLAELDAGNSGFDLERAKIQLDNARLELELTKLQMPASQKEYQLEVALKENAVKMAQLALDELNAGIADAQIQAPIDGTIISMSIAEGDTVDAFKPVMVIANMNDLAVVSQLSTDQLGQLAEGMLVEAKPVGRTGEALQGAVASLPYPYGTGSNANNQATIATITVQADLVKAGYSLGDLLQITAVLEKKENVLWLPPQVVRTFEGRKFVIVLTGGGQSRVDVKLGITSEDRVEILEGLTAGQVVIAP